LAMTAMQALLLPKADAGSNRPSLSAGAFISRESMAG
jgi:hypothetical protein